MRNIVLASVGALVLAFSAGSANAVPSVKPLPPSDTSNVIQVAGGCGWGSHRHHGYCVPNRYRPYAYYPRRYGYAPYPYYGGGYQPWNRPTPGDHVANQLNAQELGRPGWGY